LNPWHEALNIHINTGNVGRTATWLKIKL
jgi:hypothetical protein